MRQSDMHWADRSLPTALKSVRTRPLFMMTLAIQPYLVVGETPSVNRRVGVVQSGVVLIEAAVECRLRAFQGKSKQGHIPLVRRW
jgi:hypothetical protein